MDLSRAGGIFQATFNVQQRSNKEAFDINLCSRVLESLEILSVLATSWKLTRHGRNIIHLWNAFRAIFISNRGSKTRARTSSPGVESTRITLICRRVSPDRCHNEIQYFLNGKSFTISLDCQVKILLFSQIFVKTSYFHKSLTGIFFHKLTRFTQRILAFFSSTRKSPATSNGNKFPSARSNWITLES